MSVARFWRRSLSVALAGAGAATALTVITVQPAAAFVDESTCQYSYSRDRIAASCSDSDTSPWYLRIECSDTRGRDHQINGTIRYGTGTSIAQCPVATEVDAIDGIINL